LGCERERRRFLWAFWTGEVRARDSEAGIGGLFVLMGMRRTRVDHDRETKKRENRPTRKPQKTMSQTSSEQRRLRGGTPTEIVQRNACRIGVWGGKKVVI